MRASDELRFGPQRTLNLRDGLPSAADAVRRAEGWLREHQVRGSRELLIVTGRGNQSPGGIGVIRGAVEKLLFSLRRRGVVLSHREHNPGAFVVEIAPLRTLLEAPARKRDRPERAAPVAIPGLDGQTSELLRLLAECSLDALGVTPTDETLRDEMHRHLSALARSLPAGPDTEERLWRALKAAVDEYN